jgi:hypothetical protein
MATRTRVQSPPRQNRFGFDSSDSIIFPYYGQSSMPSKNTTKTSCEVDSISSNLRPGCVKTFQSAVMDQRKFVEIGRPHRGHSRRQNPPQNSPCFFSISTVTCRLLSPYSPRTNDETSFDVDGLSSTVPRICSLTIELVTGRRARVPPIGQL